MLLLIFTIKLYNLQSKEKMTNLISKKLIERGKKMTPQKTIKKEKIIL